MAKRKIVWTKTADIQLQGILEYWFNRNKSASYPKKLLKEVMKKTEQIAKNPLLFKSTSFENTFVVGLSINKS